MSDDNSTAMREMRRKFAKLIAENRETFGACVKEYEKYGPDHFMPDDGVLRKNSVPKMTLVFLLAAFKTRPRGMSQDGFCEATAEKKTKWGNRFSGGCWQTASAVERQLDYARDLERTDQAFAYEVDFTARVMQEIGWNLMVGGKIK